jgi:hypothetical protein
MSLKIICQPAEYLSHLRVAIFGGKAAAFFLYFRRVFRRSGMIPDAKTAGRQKLLARGCRRRHSVASGTPH